VHDLGSYIHYATVPTLALVLVTLGYNTRFYRAIMADEIERDHIRTLQAYGAAPTELLFKHVLKNKPDPGFDPDHVFRTNCGGFRQPFAGKLLWNPWYRPRDIQCNYQWRPTGTQSSGCPDRCTVCARIDHQ